MNLNPSHRPATDHATRSPRRGALVAVALATLAIVGVTLTGCTAGPQDAVQGSDTVSAPVPAPTLNSDLNVWNSTPTFSLVGTFKSGASTIRPSYDCNDFNRIMTSKGEQSAYPYGNYSQTTGWNYSSDNKTWVTATELAADNESGLFQFSFVNASITGTHTVSGSFRCNGAGLIDPDIDQIGMSAPTDISSTSATVHATVDEHSDWKTNPTPIDSGSYYVEYGSADNDYSHASPVYQLGNNVTNPSLTAQLTGLDPNTSYHYRFVVNPLIDTDTPGGKKGDTMYGSPHNTFSTPGPLNQTISVPNSTGPQLLEVNNNSANNGGTVDTWSQTTSDGSIANNETWNFATFGGGTTGQLVNTASKKCLEVNGTTGVIDQWTCTAGASNQIWQQSDSASGTSTLKVTLKGSPGRSDGDYYLATTKQTSDVTSGDALTLQPVASADSRSSWDITTLNH
jgi:hypothetical protein